MPSPHGSSIVATKGVGAKDPLALRLLAGDATVLAELWQAQLPLVQRWLQKCYAGHVRVSEAEDLVQEALLRLWTSRANFDPAGRVLVLFWRILRNVTLNWLKVGWHRQWMTEKSVGDTLLSRKVPAPAIDSGETPVEQITPRALPPRLRKAFEQLSDLERRVLWADACSVDGCVPSPELVRDLGISPKRVRTERCRALRKLREKVPPPEQYASRGYLEPGAAEGSVAPRCIYK